MNLSIFSNNLFEAGTEFFNQLGIQLNSNTASSLGAKELLKDHYKDKGIFKAIDEAYFLGLVDDSVFDGNTPLLNKEKISLKEAEDRLTAEYNGLMVFAVRLKDSYSPTRGEIADLTRAFNRASKSVPVVLLLKYSGLLSFAASERTKYKQAWREGEKIGKISLLKDIKVAAPHTGHLKILEDLKVAPAVTDFNALYKQWQEVFNVQLLNKKFYQELANWYFWASKTVTFPDDVEKNKDVRNATNVIRLITRMIFVWFVKEKGLIPDKLFDPSSLKDILNYSDETDSSYYKAILQNLFFATLNTEMDNDKPGSRKFVNRQYGIHYFYRYERFFSDKKKALELFKGVPFLNGGLFECLDKNVGQGNEIRIDCFSNSPAKAARLIVPDELFFSTEQPIDLNGIYGTKGKSYKVRGLINILNSYKFTIAENTPLEEEIALDPELLGKVFENLLASYNPETQSTARKQTGSFYTPREIVNYMVDESLIAYLLSKLPSPPEGEDRGEGDIRHSRENGNPEDRELNARLRTSCMTDNIEQKLCHLLSYSDELHQFTPQEVDVLINAIDNATILDPACGSGAFPMGVLHKMVHLLHKLDPDNEKWKQKQIDKVLEVPDATVREQLLDDIEESFQNNELDYGRKLYLIENCIYGVDIQPIAVQIAKLRFFISLIVDQRISLDKKNMGIRPLPNLETKFVAANTLIGIDKPAQLLLRNPEIDRKEKELKEVRERHFTARTPQTKEKYRKEDERLRAEISELLKKDGFPRETTERLAKWNPYDQNAFADFFDPEWMFGVTDGFDVVIGNPPYGLMNKRQNQVEAITVTPQQLVYFKNLPAYAPAMGGMINIFKLFILKSIYLLKNSGIFSEIFPLAFIADSSAANLRSYIFDNCCIQFIEAFPERDDPRKRVFEAAKMSVCVMNLMKTNKKRSFFIRINSDRYIDEQKQKTFLTAELIALLDKTNLTIPLMSQEDINIIAAIYRKSIRFGDIGHCYTGEIDITLGKPYISYNAQDAPLLRGAIIDRYLVRESMSQGEFLYLKKQKYLKENFGKKATHFQLERIAMQGITGVNEKIRLKMTLLDKGVFCANSINYVVFHDSQVNTKFALGVFNSRLMNYIFSKFSTNSNVNGYEVDNLPYPKISEPHIQQSLITLVDQLLTAKKKDPNTDTSALEKQIDEMVYALYGLTPEEIAIVEGKR